MTQDQIKSRVRTGLDDLGVGTFFTDIEIGYSLQDGYDLVAAVAGCIESNTTINFTSGLVYYDFSSLISDYLRIYGIYNNNTNRWMEPIDTIELYKLRDNYELANGEPYWFQPIDAKYTLIYPVPATATGSMTVLYKAKAPTFGPDVIPNIPSVNHNVLEFYGTGDLLTQCEEWIKALKFLGMFDATLEDIKKLIRNRTSPNSIYYFKG